jgi:hypothetical protein
LAVNTRPAPPVVFEDAPPSGQANDPARAPGGTSPAAPSGR